MKTFNYIAESDILIKRNRDVVNGLSIITEI